MKDALVVSALSVLPRKRGARAMGWFARRRLSRLFLRGFVRAYGVDLDEAAEPLTAYDTLEDLFTRRLKPGARPIDATPNALVSPVDGRCAAVGRTRGGRIEVAPDRWLDVPALIGRPLDEEVDVAVLYLSPTDYHRVHVPREGRAVAWRYTPGTLWPVFAAAVRRVDGLFEKNERMAVTVETERGWMEVVLVGAFGVGRIELVVSDVLANTGTAAASGALEPAIDLARGADLGVFHLGSTVVLVTPPGRWRYGVAAGDVVRLGRPIAEAAALLPDHSGEPPSA